ncbi:hybrid sensor histidine kinase/response regulator [Ideonella sp. A 288]|uniref:ATP-binding response regulator n=1 Tax=Ideonella sp. A 288 TaxID=1962181 RepID=UPI000B4A9884|nr:ATP-binding protein [Ideonella sp. A 288]
MTEPDGPAPPGPAAAAVAPTVYVAVGGPDQPPEPGSENELRQADRRAVMSRLREAALRAALANMSLWGLVIAASSLLVASAMPFGVTSAAWTLTCVFLGAMAWQMPARLGRQRPTDKRQDQLYRWLVALVVISSACMAAGPWMAPPEAPAVLLGGAAFVLVGAAAVAPVRGLDLLLCGVPASTALATWVAGNDPAFDHALAAHALMALAVLVVARQRNRAWRQNTKALIEQGDRIRTLEAERDAAARADVEKSRFLAIASHDLRQPVHALALFTATLHKRMKSSPDEPLVRNMVRAIDGLERSFNALLDISRMDAGSVAPALQTFSLRDTFRRLHMHYAGQAELAGLGLRFSPGGKSVHSDPQMLERILGNLIQNAIKYTERGGIVVVARTTANAVNVEVWDTGAGIAAEELPRIFDEFYQIGRGERDRAHGLGMGLAIVKRLVRLLGHRLTVASRVGRGTMFRVGIPIGGLPELQDALAPADTVPMQISRPQMVMVIDDEEPIREGLRGLLQEWGYQVMTAASAAQAEQVTQALEGRVDLVLSDLHLGDGADGLEAIDGVRRMCRHEVPAILITGDTAHAEIRRIASSGHMVMFKPVQPRRLYDALRNLLG